MKKQFFFLLLFGFSILAKGQTEKFDIATYSTLKGWTKTKKEGVIIFSKADSATGGFCIIALYAATPSSGSADQDFKNEWKDLAVNSYNAEPSPATETQTTAEGWKAVAGASPASQDGINSYVVLTVFSGFGKTTSVMANLNDQTFVPVLDKFLENIRLDKNASLGKTGTNNTSTGIVNNQVTGTWAKSASSPPQYNNGVLVNLANYGYQKGEYNFRSDGSYVFYGESKFNTNDFSIADETGKYTVSGSQLTLTPISSKIRKVDLNGNLKKTESLPLSKRVYTWQLHYFEGIKQTQLVLGSVPENTIDGGYGGATSFPNSFLYSKEYKPEWRFKR